MMHRIVPDSHKPGMEQSRDVFAFLMGMFQKPQRRTTFILLYATLAVTLWKYIPAELPLVLQTDAGWQMVPPDTASLGEYEKITKLVLSSGKIWGAFLLFGLLPMMFVKYLFRERLSDYGVRFGNRATLGFSLALVPLFAIVGWLSVLPAFYGVYPYSPWCLGGETSIASGWPFFVLYALMYLFLYYFSWEFFFRGFLQVGTEASVGCFNAILLQTMLSAVVHFGNPFGETVAAIGAGIFWGFLAYRCRSLVSGWLQHATTGILLDLSLLWHITGG